MMTFFNNTPSAPSSSSSKMNGSNSDEPTALVNAILAQGHTYNTEQRRNATKNMMAYLSSLLSSLGSLDSAEYVNAVTALKTLGRSQYGTEDLASEEGIKLLLELAQYPSASSSASSPLSSTSSNDAFLRDPLSQASSEAIRCLANVCLLHETGRVRLAGVDGLPEALMKSAEEATDPMTRFLSARLLFLVTVSGEPSSTIRLVENLNIARYISSRLLENLDDFTSSSPSSSNIVNPSNADLKIKIDILVEYLKIAFNVTLFYPRGIQDKKKQQATLKANGNGTRTPEFGGGQNGHSTSKQQKGKNKAESSTDMSKSLSASSTNSATSSASSSSKARSRSSSPTELLSKSTSTTATTSGNGRSKSPSNLPKMATEKIKGYFSSSSSSRKNGQETEADHERSNGKEVELDNTDILKAWGFEDVVSALVQLALCLPYAPGPDYGPFGTHKHVINALLNYNFTTYSHTVYAPLSPFSACPIPALPSTSATKAEPSLPPLVARLLALLDGCLAYYLPGRCGPDDEDAREAALSAPGVLDESLQVLILLLAKCAIEDVTGDTRREIKLCLLADDIDRSVGLEKREDLTGKLVRLLNSTYLSGSSEATGKFLFTICDQDPSALVAAIGYGNASGFLQSMNMLIPPGATAADGANNDGSSSSNSTSSSSANSRPINPITGAYESTSSSNEAMMSDEEKEREAEKLFVLFDRMNRNGAMSVVNPVKQAQENGQLTTTTEEEELERKKMEDADEEDERQALAELQAYKERKNRTK